MNVEELNARFGIGPQLKFVLDDSGIVVIEIENKLASAKICLQGAHLKSWRPRTTSIPVVWYPEDVKMAIGKSVHGGAPVCWPWFGVHASEPTYPSHGYARVAPWQVIESGEQADGASRLVLQMLDSPQKQKYWPKTCDLRLTLIIGSTLNMQLTTTNTGKEAITYTEAIHTYFEISDIEKIGVVGLADCTYLDKVGETVSRIQEGIISFSGETDRIYINTESDCVIEDYGLQRKISIRKTEVIRRWSGIRGQKKATNWWI